jgi:immune inhibitor A
MKRGLLLFILLIPFALASPPPLDFTDNGIEYVTEVASVSQIGGIPLVETYTKEEHCPVIFQKDSQGKKQPYFAQPDADGYMQPTELSPKQTKISKAKEQISCGDTLKQTRPFPPKPPGKWSERKVPLQRLRANAELGMGYKLDAQGNPIYLNQELKTAVQNNLLLPPRLPLPKPTITITGNVIYEVAQEQKQLAAIVIPIQFPDEEAKFTIEEINDKFFGNRGFSKFYYDQSYGNLEILGNVASQWYTLEEDMGYYGDNYEANIEEMITEAIYAADAEIDFSQYDYNDDGIVDGLFVVHAGEPDENGGGNKEEIWSHYYSITPITVDGIQIIDYETVSEESPIGIIAHEFGHYLGLPDMYDTDTSDGSSKGVGEWSVMGYGAYLEPAGSFDPWSKIYLNWLGEDQYTEITEDGYYTISEDLSTEGTKYYSIPFSSEELFLIENRHETELMNGDDASGILIWHIDETILYETGKWSGCSGTRFDCNTVNSNTEHKLIDVEEADGKDDLDNNDLGDEEDLWYYGETSTFSSTSRPDSTSYDGSMQIFLDIYSKPSSTMSFGVSTTGASLAPRFDEATNSEISTSQKSSENVSSSKWLIIAIISSIILISGGITIFFISKKKDSVISPEKFKSF